MQETKIKKIMQFIWKLVIWISIAIGFLIAAALIMPYIVHKIYN